MSSTSQESICDTGELVKKPIRVLIFMADSQPGGGMVHLLQIARFLDRDAFHLEFALPASGPLPDSLRQMGEQIHVIDLRHRLDWSAIRNLSKLCREQDIDILNSHNVRANIHARLAGRSARVPVVVSTIHNSVFNYDVSPLLQHLYAATERYTFRWCSQVIAVSEGIAHVLRQRYRLPPNRITVIPNGVDLEQLEPSTDRDSIRASFGLEPRSKAILQIGRLTPQKGFDVLLKALSLMKDTHPEAVLLIVGDGPLRGELESQARDLGVTGQTRFLGHQEGVADLLHAADIVTLASRSEGMPYTLLEAMAAGRAVVATSIPGIKEVVLDNETALLVAPEDSRALASAVSSLLSDRTKTDSLGSAARNHIREFHTSQIVVSQLEDLYSRLMDRSGS
ncbi:glycosyltransferase family 4 protein [Gemmatimonadota bacterium]